MSSSVLALTTGILSLLLLIIFAIEARRGVRIFEPIRRSNDAFVGWFSDHLRMIMPRMNRFFVREVMHYVVHVGLSRVLRVFRALERWVLSVVRFNRSRARMLRRVDEKRSESGHLYEIQEHKKVTELSESDKTKRKDDVLDNTV